MVLEFLKEIKEFTLMLKNEIKNLMNSFISMDKNQEDKGVIGGLSDYNSSPLIQKIIFDSGRVAAADLCLDGSLDAPFKNNHTSIISMERLVQSNRKVNASLVKHAGFHPVIMSTSVVIEALDDIADFFLRHQEYEYACAIANLSRGCLKASIHRNIELKGTDVFIADSAMGILKTAALLSDECKKCDNLGNDLGDDLARNGAGVQQIMREATGLFATIKQFKQMTNEQLSEVDSFLGLDMLCWVIYCKTIDLFCDGVDEKILKNIINLKIVIKNEQELADRFEAFCPVNDTLRSLPIYTKFAMDKGIAHAEAVMEYSLRLEG